MEIRPKLAEIVRSLAFCTSARGAREVNVKIYAVLALMLSTQVEADLLWISIGSILEPRSSTQSNRNALKYPL